LEKEMTETRNGKANSSLTIKGDQPNKRHKFAGKIQVPVGVEKILFRAAGDEGFKERLLSDRAEAIEESSVTLRSSEAGMLTAISNEALSNMIASINPENPKRRKFMGLVAATAASIVAGTVDSGCQSAGVSVDTDQPSSTDTAGADPDTDIDGGMDGGVDTDTVDTDQPTDDTMGHTGSIENDEDLEESEEEKTNK
jgi:hypothetical protein